MGKENWCKVKNTEKQRLGSSSAKAVHLYKTKKKKKTPYFPLMLQNRTVRDWLN